MTGLNGSWNKCSDDEWLSSSQPAKPTCIEQMMTSNQNKNNAVDNICAFGFLRMPLPASASQNQFDISSKQQELTAI